MKNTMKTVLSATAAAVALAAVLSAPTGAQAQEPMLGELRSMGYNFCPRGWAAANGQILPINQNQSLYSLLGTTYGGDGRTSFALPDLRGRVAIAAGNRTGGSSYALGQRGGVEAVTLTVAQMPSHSHTARALSADGNTTAVAGASFAIGKNLLGSEIAVYSDAAPDSTLAASAVSNVGGGQAHQNMPPYLVTNWCIALQGLFPSRN